MALRGIARRSAGARLSVRAHVLGSTSCDSCVVGPCVAPELVNPLNGDRLQTTQGGLLVAKKSGRCGPRSRMEPTPDRRTVGTSNATKRGAICLATPTQIGCQSSPRHTKASAAARLACRCAHRHHRCGPWPRSRVLRLDQSRRSSLCSLRLCQRPIAACACRLATNARLAGRRLPGHGSRS
jgi:hypothetical protein